MRSASAASWASASDAREARARVRTVLASTCVAALALLSLPGSAAACEEAVEFQIAPQQPTPVQEVARAEKALENGQNLVAMQAILGSFPKVRGATAGNNPLETRAIRVFAL